MDAPQDDSHNVPSVQYENQEEFSCPDLSCNCLLLWPTYYFSWVCDECLGVNVDGLGFFPTTELASLNLPELIEWLRHPFQSDQHRAPLPQCNWQTDALASFLFIPFLDLNGSLFC